MTQDKAFTIVIQAGGQSSRMGRDKALMQFLGQPLIVRQISRLRNTAALNALELEIVIITNRPEAYSFLQVPLHEDVMPGLGPLGGLFTALQIGQSPVIAVVACDMPFLNGSLLLAQHDLLVKEGADVVIPRSDNRLEPLHAVYRRSACLPAVRAALDAGERKVISWFAAVKVREMTLEEVAAYDPHGLSFSNVNSPEDFKQAEQAAARLEG